MTQIAAVAEPSRRRWLIGPTPGMKQLIQMKELLEAFYTPLTISWFGPVPTLNTTILELVRLLLREVLRIRQ
jgi:hypothetical protein